MTHPRLEALRASAEPKCANCRWWEQRDNDKANKAKCELHELITLDLDRCSAWELHEVHFGRVMKADEEE